MRLNCPTCKSDFIVSDDEVNPSKPDAACPFCATEYKLIFRGDREPEVVFGPGRAKKVRVCIECGKEFAADQSEAIPVCSACKKGKSGSQVDVQGWKLLKAGKVIDLRSEELVREWIRDGAIGLEDPLISPEGKEFPAKRFERFSEDFQVQRSRPRSSAQNVGTGRRFPKFSTLFRWLAYTAVLAAISWSGYRVFTYAPSGPLADPDLRRFEQMLEKRAPQTSTPAKELLEKGLTLLARDLPSAYDEACAVLEQAVLADRSSSEALGALAEAYARASETKEDPQGRIAAASLSNLVVKLFPDRVDGYIGRIRSSLSSGDLSAPKQDLLTGLSIEPGSPRLMLARAAFFLAASQDHPPTDELFQSARAALMQRPDLVEAYDLIGRAYIARADPLKAREAFGQRLKAFPSDPKAMVRMGELQERAENMKLAKEWYQSALKEDGRSVAARLRLALILNAVEHQPVAAERHLRDILGLFRRFASAREVFDAQREMIRILLETGRSAEAGEWIGRFPGNLSGSPEATIARAEIQMAVGKPQDAVPILREAVSSATSDPRILLLLSRAFEMSGSIEDAVKAYREIAKTFPRWFWPYGLGVSLLASAKRFQEAVDFANLAVNRPALSIDPGPAVGLIDRFPAVEWKAILDGAEKLARSGVETSVGHAFLGLALLAKGVTSGTDEEVGRAATEFERSGRGKISGEIRFLLLGRARFESKNHTAALTAFRAALKDNPASTAARYWIGTTLKELKQWDEAKSRLSTLTNDPEWGGRALYDLGSILASENLVKEAKEHWLVSLQADPRFTPAWKALLAVRD